MGSFLNLKHWERNGSKKLYSLLGTGRLAPDKPLFKGVPNGKALGC